MMENQKIEIPYNKHDYGLVLRTSGIFYFKKSNNVKTTISILNYWKLKRNLDVTLVASIRKMDGSLVKRSVLNFQNGNVINYSPDIPEELFEGSVEIEAFSITDMVIPYIGIIAVYQTKYGISMVHSYGRAYSNYEIEENRILAKAEESCCNACKDTEEYESFAIFHNGGRSCPEQKIRVSILNHKGERREKSFQLHELAPYETIKIRLQDCFPDLVHFLNGNVGYSSYSFHLNKSAFPRMISVNQKRDESDMQVTHSNFNLAKHDTAKIRDGRFAFMPVPRIINVEEKVVIFPDCVPGEYVATSKSGISVSFNENKAAIIPIESQDSELITFKKLSDQTPNRIHTSIQISKSSSRIPAEVCLGVEHDEVAPKHFFWGICAANSKIKSQIMIQQYQTNPMVEIPNSSLAVRIYSDTSFNYKELLISPTELRNGKYISELFPGIEEFLGTGYGWFSIYNHHTHSVVYSTLENESESIAMEHTM